MAWCFAEEATPATAALLDRVGEQGAVVPALWRWEVGNVLISAVRRRRLAFHDVSSRLTLLATLPVVIDDDGIGRAWRETLLIAQADGLTVYDAAYLELALRRGYPLASFDRDLCAAAARRGVPLLV